MLQEDDEVVNMITENHGSHILCISEKGLGKLTKMSEFRLQHRGGRGIKCYKITEKSGKLVGARAVNESDELLLITTEGVMIRTGCAEISILGRNTTGVKIMDLREGETIAGFTKVKMGSVEEAEEITEEKAEKEVEEEAKVITEEKAEKEVEEETEVITEEVEEKAEEITEEITEEGEQQSIE
jgi:DNA gyrase subunit A